VRRSLVLLLLAGAGRVADAAPSAEPPGYRVEDLVARALKASPELDNARAGLEGAAAKRAQADAARWPQLQVTVVGGPSPQARGTVLSSPDRKDDPVINGVFGRIDMTVVQPLFTFGRISGLRAAAEAGARVEEARVSEAQAGVVVRMKELYYGKLLTADLLALVDEILEALDRAIDRTKRRLAGGAPNADEADLYKLDSFRAIAAETRTQVKKDQDMASAALRAFANLAPDDPVRLDREGLERLPAPADAEGEAIGHALDWRPEMRQVRAGLVATDQLVRAERGTLFPQFFLGATGFYSVASNRDFQQNPFIYDPLHDRIIAAVVGVRYQLDFGITLGRVRERRAEHARVEALGREAEMGIPLQVRLARRELAAAEETIKSTDQGSRSSRQWLVVAQSNYDVGVGDTRDLGDAVQNYARLRADYLLAIYHYDVAIARLDHVTGRDAVAPVAEEGTR
jgi:outer membrane protein